MQVAVAEATMGDLGRWESFALLVALVAAVFGLQYWLTQKLPPHDPPHDRAGGGPGED